jgi:hypothetical protein
MLCGTETVVVLSRLTPHYLKPRAKRSYRWGGRGRWLLRPVRSETDRRRTNQPTNQLTNQPTNKPTNQPTNQLQNRPWEANRSSDNDYPFIEPGFIITFTTPHQWSPSWAKWIQSIFFLARRNSRSVVYGSNCSELSKKLSVCEALEIHFNIFFPSTSRSFLQVFQPKLRLSGDMIRNFISQKGNSQKVGQWNKQLQWKKVVASNCVYSVTSTVCILSQYLWTYTHGLQCACTPHSSFP